jgi:hypothetical protein
MTTPTSPATHTAAASHNRIARATGLHREYSQSSQNDASQAVSSWTSAYGAQMIDTIGSAAN